MKITMKKHSMTRTCQESEQALLESAGWVRADSKPIARKTEDEVIAVLRAPAKSKSADKSLDNAIKGDE